MYIPNDYFDEEIFPTAYFITFSIDADRVKSSTAHFTDNSDGNNAFEQNGFCKQIIVFCLANDFELKMIRTTQSNIYLVVSKFLNLTSKDLRHKNQTDMISLSSKIIEMTDNLGKLDTIYELWNDRQIVEAMRFVENAVREIKLRQY